MTIAPVTESNFSEAVQLLQQNNLPTEDLSSRTKLYALYEQNELIGTVGVELFQTEGLLRSLCITSNKRVHGSGSQLVAFAEEAARSQGVTTLYLLTTTAADFFGKRNYQTIARNEVPQSIRQSTEFASVCPSSATVMKKELV